MNYPHLDKFIARHGIKHFTASEVAKLEVPSMELWSKIIPTLQVLEWLRAELNKYTKEGDLECYLVVTSGYRSPSHNARIGGAPNSMHKQFNAIDFMPYQGKRPMDLDTIVRILERHPLAKQFGMYKEAVNFIHLDTRGVFEQDGLGVRF